MRHSKAAPAAVSQSVNSVTAVSEPKSATDRAQAGWGEDKEGCAAICLRRHAIAPSQKQRGAVCRFKLPIPVRNLVRGASTHSDRQISRPIARWLPYGCQSRHRQIVADLSNRQLLDVIGTDGGTRTRTPKREADFKSAASTVSPRPPTSRFAMEPSQPSPSPSCGSPPSWRTKDRSSSAAASSRSRSVLRNTKVTPKSPRRK